MTAPPTTDIAAFLLERLDEDEAAAQSAGHGCGYLHEHNGGWVEVALPEEHNVRPTYEMRFIRMNSPARVLAQVAAMRRIVKLHVERAVSPSCAECGGYTASSDEVRGIVHHGYAIPWPCPTLKALASMYAAAPGFDPRWAE